MVRETVIKCECGRKVVEVTPFEKSYYDPHYNCPRCKKKGVLIWEKGMGKVRIVKG